MSFSTLECMIRDGDKSRDAFRYLIECNPPLLTSEAGYVLEKLIPVTAGPVVVGAIPNARRGQTVGELLTEKPRGAPSPASPRG